MRSGDYKSDIQELAERIAANELETDYFDLPKELQETVYVRAEDSYWDSYWTIQRL